MMLSQTLLDLTLPGCRCEAWMAVAHPNVSAGVVTQHHDDTQAAGNHGVVVDTCAGRIVPAMRMPALGRPRPRDGTAFLA